MSRTWFPRALARVLVAALALPLLVLVPVLVTVAPAGAQLDRDRVFVIADSVVLGVRDRIPEELSGYRVYVDGVPAIPTDTAARVVSDHAEMLGRVAVVATGYNYPYLDPPRFDRQVDTMMRTLLGHGVERIVWLMLREAAHENSPPSSWWQVDKYAFYFPDVNQALREATTRWPQLQLADWRSLSTPSGLTYDAIHLNTDGSREMVRLIHREVDHALALLDGLAPPAATTVPGRLGAPVVGRTEPLEDPCRGVPAWADANDAFWAARTAGDRATLALDPDGDAVPCEHLAGAPAWPTAPRTPPASHYPEASAGAPVGGPVSGYWMLDLGGTVYGFGTARAVAPQPADWSVALAAAGRGGYWVLRADGRVEARDAPALGDAQLAPGEQPVAMLGGPDGDGDGRADGYWVVTDRGRVQAFGVTHLGDMAGTALGGRVIAAAPTASGAGYWLVGSDGGVFSFGDAAFSGSMGGQHLNRPVVGIVGDADGTGYWLVASDGGIFAFDAGFRGSMGGTPLSRPVVGAVAHGAGYLLVGSDGGVFAFSDLPFLGSLGDRPPPTPVVAVTSAR